MRLKFLSLEDWQNLVVEDLTNTRQTFRAAIGLDGTFSNGFDWDLYYSYGFSDRMQYSGAYNAANMAYAVQCHNRSYWSQFV